MKLVWVKINAGIMVLPDKLKPGTIAANYFKPYTDWIL